MGGEEVPVNALGFSVEQAKEDHARLTEVIFAGAKRIPKAQPYIEKAAPLLAGAVVVFRIVLPLYVKLLRKLYEVYCMLPHNIVISLYGFALCFLGGQYDVLIAAIETYKITGYESTIKNLQILHAQYK